MSNRWNDKDMRRILSVAVLFLSVFLITAIPTAFITLDIGPWPSHDFINKLQQGHLYLIFFTKSTWANYPSFPYYYSQGFIDIPTFLYGGFLILCMCYFLGYRRKWQFIYIGLLCLAIGLISYSIRVKILLNLGISHYPYSADPDTWGRYSVMMLIELLYSSVACAVFAVLDIFKINFSRQKLYLSPSRMVDGC